jgi:hypothetical protein
MYVPTYQATQQSEMFVPTYQATQQSEMCVPTYQATQQSEIYLPTKLHNNPKCAYLSTKLHNNLNCTYLSTKLHITHPKKQQLSHFRSWRLTFINTYTFQILSVQQMMVIDSGCTYHWSPGDTVCNQQVHAHWTQSAWSETYRYITGYRNPWNEMISQCEIPNVCVNGCTQLRWM